MLKIWLGKCREPLCTPVVKTSLTLCALSCAFLKNKLGNTLSRITRSTKTYGSRNMEPMVPNKGFHQFPQSLQINSFLFPIKYPRAAALKLWWYRMPQHVLPCPGKSRTHSIVVRVWSALAANVLSPKHKEHLYRSLIIF